MFVWGVVNFRYLVVIGGILMEYLFVIEIKKILFLVWSVGLKIYKVVLLSSVNWDIFWNVYFVYLFFFLY